MAGNNDKNTLQSAQSYAALLALGEGEIEGLFADSVVYSNENNGTNVNLEFAFTTGKDGTAQKIISGFEEIGDGAGILADTSLRYNIPQTVIVPADVNYIIILFNFKEGFYEHTAANNYVEVSFETEISIGDADGNNFLIYQKELNIAPELDFTTGKIVARPANVNVIRKSGKSMTPYTFSFRIDKPVSVATESAWSVRLKRVLPTDLNENNQNDDVHYYKAEPTISISGYRNIKGVTYAGTALLAARIEDASKVNNTEPNFGVLIRGLKAYIPSNYTPSTHTFDETQGNWSGQFSQSTYYTANYAILLYNLLSDKLKKKIPIVAKPNMSNPDHYREIQIGFGIPEAYLAKYSFYNFAKYCDEPLYTFNQIKGGSQYAMQTKVYGIHSKYVNHQLYDYYMVSFMYPDNIIKVGDVINIISDDATVNFSNKTVTSITNYIENNKTISYIFHFEVTETEYNAINPLVFLTSSTNIYSYFIGSIERRHELNGQFVERQDAETFLNDILSIGHCYIAEILGLYTVVWDSKVTTTEIEQSPIFTNQNVSEGAFEYTNSHISENFTQINVTIQDKDNLNKTKTIIVTSFDLVDWLNSQEPTYEGTLQNPPLPSVLLQYFTIDELINDTVNKKYKLHRNYFIDRYGFVTKDITFQGCTSSAAASRKARNLLWDSLLNNHIVNFKPFVEGAALYRGRLIRVLDASINNIKATGRIVSYAYVDNFLELTLDRQLVEADKYKSIYFYEDSLLQDTFKLTDSQSFTTLSLTKRIIADVNGSTIKVSLGEGTIIRPPIADSIFMIESDKLELFKVVSTTYNSDDSVFETSALRFDNRKFDFIDSHHFSYDLQPTIISKNNVPVSAVALELKSISNSYAVHATVTLYSNYTNETTNTLYELEESNGFKSYFEVNWYSGQRLIKTTRESFSTFSNDVEGLLTLLPDFYEYIETDYISNLTIGISVKSAVTGSTDEKFFHFNFKGKDLFDLQGLNAVIMQEGETV